MIAPGRLLLPPSDGDVAVTAACPVRRCGAQSPGTALPNNDFSVAALVGAPTALEEPPVAPGVTPAVEDGPAASAAGAGATEAAAGGASTNGPSPGITDAAATTTPAAKDNILATA